MADEPYDSRPETQEHIDKVRANIALAISNLQGRAVDHDASKLVSPEVEAFDVATPKLQYLEYASDEYKQSLVDLGPALEHHFAENDHHPEHWENGVAGMSTLAITEMVCDWKAASERTRKPTPAPEGRAAAPAYDSDFDRSLTLNQERWGYGDEIASIIRNTAIELGFIPGSKRGKEDDS